MAAQTNPDATAASNAPKPAGSGASTALTTTTTANPSLVSLTSTAAFDVEDMLTDEVSAPEPESNQDDPNRDDNPDAEKQTGDDPASDEAKPEDKADESSEHNDEEPEVVEDQDGKRLVSAKHLERALKQRATAKTGEREALARAEAAEKQAAELKAQIEASTEPVASKEAPLSRLTAGMKVDLDNAEHLENLEIHAQAWLDWCEENPLGGTPGEGQDEWGVKEVVQKKRWAQAVLKAIPESRDFQAGFKTERAKIKAEMPKLFQVGTEEQKAFAAEQRRILNASTAKDQDHIIARQVLTKDIPLSKLAELAERYREERDGIASFARVPKKASATTGNDNPDKPRPKPMQVSTRPVGSVKPGHADGSRITLAQKLAAGPQDVEALFDAA